VEIWDRDTVSRYLALGDESRITVLHPHIVNTIGNANGLRVLDFGSGEARLAVDVARRGAAHVLAVDANPAMIDAAMETVSHLPEPARARIDLRVADEASLELTESYDVIICSLVLMMISSYARMSEIVVRLAKALEPSGRLIVAVTHPCFRSAVHSTFRNELPVDFEYWRSGTPYSVHMGESESDPGVVVTDFHWTLEDYCGAIEDAGLRLNGANELGTMPAPEGGFRDDPAYLVLDSIR
jgi:SAM-dependent methyltransferase